MNQVERLDMTKGHISTLIGKTLVGVESGTVSASEAFAKERLHLSGDQEFITLMFSDGRQIRIESRSGWKDEGGFLVLK